jgi:hypothetical protein
MQESITTFMAYRYWITSNEKNPQNNGKASRYLWFHYLLSESYSSFCQNKIVEKKEPQNNPEMLSTLKIEYGVLECITS